MAGAFLALFACSRSEKQPPPPVAHVTNTPAVSIVETNLPPAPPSRNAPSNAPGVLLQVRWPAGNRWVYRMELSQSSTNSVAPTAETTVEELSVGLTYSLLGQSPTPAGEQMLEMEFLAYEMEIRLAEKTVISFDTAAKPENASTNLVPAPFRKLINSKLLLLLAPTGKLEGVLGLEQWLKSLTGDNAGPAGEMLVQQFTEGFFQQVAGFGDGLPAGAVTVGGRWPYKKEIPAGALGKIAVDSLITLDRLEDREGHRFAVLTADGKFRGISAPTDGNTGGITLEHGVVSSTTWFNLDAGSLFESIVEQSMQLRSSPPNAPDAPQPAAEGTSQLAQKVTLKLVELTAGTPAPRPQN